MARVETQGCAQDTPFQRNSHDDESRGHCLHLHKLYRYKASDGADNEDSWMSTGDASRPSPGHQRSMDLSPATTREDPSRSSSRARSGTTSVYRGVCWNKKNKRWQASINVSGKYVYLGSFREATEAARAFDWAAVHHRGERARLNFPNEVQDIPSKEAGANKKLHVAAMVTRPGQEENQEEGAAAALSPWEAPPGSAVGASGREACMDVDEAPSRDGSASQPPRQMSEGGSLLSSASERTAAGRKLGAQPERRALACSWPACQTSSSPSWHSDLHGQPLCQSCFTATAAAGGVGGAAGRSALGQRLEDETLRSHEHTTAEALTSLGHSTPAAKEEPGAEADAAAQEAAATLQRRLQVPTKHSRLLPPPPSADRPADLHSSAVVQADDDSPMEEGVAADSRRPLPAPAAAADAVQAGERPPAERAEQPVTVPLQQPPALARQELRPVVQLLEEPLLQSASLEPRPAKRAKLPAAPPSLQAVKPKENPLPLPERDMQAALAVECGVAKEMLSVIELIKRSRTPPWAGVAQYQDPARGFVAGLYDGLRTHVVPDLATRDDASAVANGVFELYSAIPAMLASCKEKELQLDPDIVPYRNYASGKIVEEQRPLCMLEQVVKSTPCSDHTGGWEEFVPVDAVRMHLGGKVVDMDSLLAKFQGGAGPAPALQRFVS